jgi:hypothetical protein
MDRVEELEKALAVSEAKAEALSVAAVGILRELANDRGAGPWFGGLLSRLQMEQARSEWKWHAPDEIAEATGSAIYGVFSVVLKDVTVPDFRYDAAVSADGASNRLLSPAVASALMIAVRVLADHVRRTGGEELLGELRIEAIGKAEVQNVPGDALGALKDRWIGAGIAAIEAGFERNE